MEGRVDQRAATPCITPTIKHQGGSVMVCVCEWGCQLQSWGCAPREGQSESEWLSQHTAVLCDPIWNVACGSKICTNAR